MKATGRPWFEWMREMLFEPSGMHSVVELDPHAIIPHRVSSYTFNEQQRLIRDDRTDVDYDTFYNDLGMPVGDFARWIIMLDGHGPLSEASVRRMWTPTVLADGSPAREVYSFSGYGLGSGLDDVLGEPVVLHTGRQRRGLREVPTAGPGCGRLHQSRASQGLRPGWHGHRHSRNDRTAALAGEPRRAQVRRAPPAAKALRRDYELFLAGTPELHRYATHMQPTIWQNRETFHGRSPRLGPLVSWQFLRAAPVDGEPTLLFRAKHARGIYTCASPWTTR